MLNLEEVSEKLMCMLGDIDPHNKIYDYFYYSDKKNDNPIIPLVSCIVVDLEDFTSLHSCKDFTNSNFLPLGYYTFRNINQYYGTADSCVMKSISNLLKILEELEIKEIGINLVGNYSRNVYPIKRTLKSLESFGWIPSGYDSKNSMLTIKNNNSKN